MTSAAKIGAPTPPRSTKRALLGESILYILTSEGGEYTPRALAAKIAGTNVTEINHSLTDLLAAKKVVRNKIKPWPGYGDKFKYGVANAG